MDDTDFGRTAVWDYVNSRVFLYRGKTLVEFDDAKKSVRRFPLSMGKLKVP